MKEESTLEYCQIFNVTEEQKKSKDDFLTLPDVAQVGGLIVPSPSRSSKITEAILNIAWVGLCDFMKVPNKNLEKHEGVLFYFLVY